MAHNKLCGIVDSLSITINHKVHNKYNKLKELDQERKKIEKTNQIVKQMLKSVETKLNNKPK